MTLEPFLKRIDAGLELVLRCLLVPVILVWDLVLLALFVILEVAWLGFVFGSVAGVILLLIFWPAGFLFPGALLGLLLSPLFPFEDKKP